MSLQASSPIIPDEYIFNQILIVRGQKVMLDRDLAVLYNVETKVLKQAVKRNISRFPVDFMFEMDKIEFENWRSQIVTSNTQSIRYMPFCFTEQGVAMLSSVLNSERAIQVNIQIMRTFSKMRQMLFDNTELRLAIEELKKKSENHSKNIELVFNYLDELIEKKEKVSERNKIGYVIPKN